MAIGADLDGTGGATSRRIAGEPDGADAGAARAGAARADWALWLPLAAAFVLLAWHAWQYDFITDDAYISFVFSRNLAEHGELTFNLGDPVEGYTNFLWTFVLGLVAAADLPIELAAKLLALACAGVTLATTARLLRRVGVAGPVAAVPALLLASSSGFACWTSGGLETQLFTMLVTLAVSAYVAGDAARGRLGLWLALAAMTRPEGLLVAAVLGGHRLVGNLVGARRLLPDAGERRTLLVFLLLWGPWFTWRWWFYGYPFPNTYYVKAHGPWQPARLASEMWEVGGHYLAVWVRQVELLWAAPLLAVGVLARRRGRLVLVVAAAVGAAVATVHLAPASWWPSSPPARGAPAVPAFVPGAVVAVAVLVPWLVELAGRLRRGDAPPPATTTRATLVSVLVLLALVYLPYTASVGGDFMGLHRFIMPVFVVVAVLAGLGVDGLAGWLRPPWPRVVGLGLAAIVVVGFFVTQRALTRTSLDPTRLGNDRGIDTPAFLIVYTEDRARIGRHMAPCFRADDTSIVGGAGAQPYFGRMRAIDVFGLVSERVAHEEPRIRARAGHTKFASERLLVEYDPTFVFSCYDLHRQLPAPRLPCAGYWLGRGYEQVTLHIPGLRERGEYYTFLAKKERALQCPGRVP
ncbi:MAG: hypothetical protein KA297_04415 [Kofleriaceae bacterium]|jgi:hypothetical protein|nr:hypothetical protein [Kofleriaceae bacterium]MBP6836241.1 hypothetical protein [Kofleriaceae bacterium]